MDLETEYRPTVSEAIENLAGLARSMNKPVVMSTDVAADGRAHEVACFVPQRGQARTTLPVDVVFDPAEKTGAPSVLLVSGTAKAVAEIEPDDIEFTRRVIAAGKACGIELLDHILISGAGETRLREATDLWREHV